VRITTKIKVEIIAHIIKTVFCAFLNLLIIENDEHNKKKGINKVGP